MRVKRRLKIAFKYEIRADEERLQVRFLGEQEYPAGYWYTKLLPPEELEVGKIYKVLRADTSYPTAYPDFFIQFGKTPSDAAWVDAIHFEVVSIS